MRFRLGILDSRGRLTLEEFFPNLRQARVRINSFRRQDPTLIRTNAIFVQDTIEGTEWTVDQDWTLIEM